MFCLTSSSLVVVCVLRLLRLMYNLMGCLTFTCFSVHVHASTTVYSYPCNSFNPTSSFFFSFSLPPKKVACH
eukprot:m.329820 g.329820  ORF g.329820 m.329820 type:complete len:72 (+) comp16041_c0_seq2:1048-1263(+)